MILQNILRVIMTIMYTSTALRIIFLILRIMAYWNRSDTAGIFIFLPAAATTKILLQAAGLPNNYTIKEFGTSWISGAPNGRMTGIPGGKCCRIIWGRGFEIIL